MKYHWLILSFLFLSCTSPASKVEPSLNIDYNKNIVQIFKIAVLSSDRKNIYVDTIGLICSKGLDSEFTNQMKWEFMALSNGKYSSDKERVDNAAGTGLILNDSLLFLHPPRHSYLTTLQFCPYPNFHLSKGRLKKTWTWEFIIGKNWAIDSLYPIKTIDTFNIKYKNQGKKIIDVLGKKFFCSEISAISDSKYGQTFSKFFLDSSNSIVEFECRNITDTIYRFLYITSYTKSEYYFFPIN